MFSRNDTQELGCRMLSAEISPPPHCYFCTFILYNLVSYIFAFSSCTFFFLFASSPDFLNIKLCFQIKADVPFELNVTSQPSDTALKQFVEKSEPFVVLLKYLFSCEVFFGHTVHFVFHLAHSVHWLSCFFLGQFSWSVDYFAKAESCLPRLDSS